MESSNSLPIHLSSPIHLFSPNPVDPSDPDFTNKIKHTHIAAFSPDSSTCVGNLGSEIKCWRIPDYHVHSGGPPPMPDMLWKTSLNRNYSIDRDEDGGLEEAKLYCSNLDSLSNLDRPAGTYFTIYP